MLNEDAKGGSRGDKYEMWKIRALAEMQRGERKGGDRVRNVPTFFGGGYLS